VIDDIGEEPPLAHFTQDSEAHAKAIGNA
jgi:hypothetical protein